jgi:predicted Zn finger-like uncharacterized protein
MKVRCSHCNAAYSVDDAKIAGKMFGFDCPKCGTNVVIDNRPAVAAAPSLQPAAALKKSPVPPAPTVLPGQEIEMPSFDEQKSEPLKDEIGTSQESFGGDFSDEVEPEIDLSVLNKTDAELPEITEDEDLLGSDLEFSIPEEDLSSSGHTASVKDLSPKESDEDESITIDLDSLDIELTEPEEMKTGENFADFPVVDELTESEKIILGNEETELLSGSSSSASEDDDESITLDLESLDIPLEESDEILGGDSPVEEDSRLSLGDAGLSIDDVEREAIKGEEAEEDDFRLTLDEIDSNINMEEISEFAAAESVSDEIDRFDDRPLSEAFTSERLPELDFDNYDSAPAVASLSHIPSAPAGDQFLDIEDKNSDSCDVDSGFYGNENVAAAGGGYINLSIDYALHYSRLKAFLRLIGIYLITFIPHFVVSFVYSLIAGFVGAVNKIIILFGGERQKDFSMMQEQSLRYSVSIYASILNVIEEKPTFAGRRDIDYQLQFNVVYPPKNSRVLAFLRLTVIGIVILALPHILLLTVLSIGMSLIIFVSLIFTIFAGKWPSIMFDFMVRYLRYYTSVYAYMNGLVDTYPSFRFE